MKLLDILNIYDVTMDLNSEAVNLINGVMKIDLRSYLSDLGSLLIIVILKASTVLLGMNVLMLTTSGD